MNINFHRRGFANNSSSSHSIIVTSPETFNATDDVEPDWSFGWDEFVCKSKKEKALYLLTVLKSEIIGNNMSEFATKALLNGLKSHVAPMMFGLNPGDHTADNEIHSALDYINEELDDSSVDHQSLFFFPHVHSDAYFTRKNPWSVDIDGDFIDLEFFAEFSKYVINGDFLILGGHDNGDNEFQNDYENETPNSFKDIMNAMNYGAPTVVKDGDNWILYKKGEGDELCFSFGDEDTKVASFPTLIDLKITDQCRHGCPHCYQGSNRDGEHARCNDVTSILYSLKQMGTGTVAIGGGNPLLHPDLIKILTTAYRYMTTCITVNTLNTVEEKATMVKVFETVDSVAVTINSARDVVRTLTPFFAARDESSSTRRSIYVQGILEMFETEKDLTEYLFMVKNSGISNITFLGYKETGRATDSPKPNVAYDWIKVCQESGLNVGIDADIALRYKNVIHNKGVQDKYLCNEGDRSMYIDAVEKKIYKDSYSGGEGVPLSHQRYGVGNEDHYVSTFQSFKEVSSESYIS